MAAGKNRVPTRAIVTAEGRGGIDMVFDNPAAFWLLAVIILVLILGFWGWKAKREIIKLWLDERNTKNSQIKKYILAIIMVTIVVLIISVPMVPFALPINTEKEGLIVFMVDVSASMAAKEDLDSPNRLERVKLMLSGIIDEFPEARFYPFHFTSMARSLTPPLDKEDFSYLKRSIARVLDINSVSGQGSSFGTPISQVLDKISKEEKVKIIVLFSDGEFFQDWGTDSQDSDLDPALRKAVQENVKIITVGVGERKGSRIPLYNQKGEFTGEFARYDGKVFTTSLEEGTLKLIASKTDGKYFFEENYKGIIDFLNKNMESSAGKEKNGYEDIGYLMLIPLAVLWVVFAKVYLK